MWRYLKDLEPEILFDSLITLLAIYPKEYILFYYKDTCTCMLTAALVPTTKVYNQPKYVSMMDWIKRMWYIYSMEYSATIKKTEIMSFAGT